MDSDPGGSKLKLQLIVGLFVMPFSARFRK